jgi:hypothetical protein
VQRAAKATGLTPQILAQVREIGADRLAEAVGHGVQTRMHLCATLTGSYHFLLKFEYRALSDVALAVLSNSRHFETYLDST